MIIPKQDKVKRLLLPQLDAQVPEEKDQKSLQKWIQATLSKQKNQELGMIAFMQPLQSVQMHHQVPRVPLFTVDHIAKPEPNAAQTLEDQQFEDPESRELFLDCLTMVWHRDKSVFARQLEEYSDEAHLSAVKAAIQYSETLLQSQDDFFPNFEGKDEEGDYSCLQNPTQTPIISKDFLRALPLCPIIHCMSQMYNNPKLCFCPCSSHSRPWREKIRYLFMMIMNAR